MMIESGMVCEALRRRGELERKPGRALEVLCVVAGWVASAAMAAILAASLFAAILWG